MNADKLVFVLVALCAALACNQSMAQTNADSTIIKDHSLNEVIIKTNQTKQTKNLSLLDEYLEQLPNVNMLKRGAYAWEPLLNGMSTERSVITIDGMRIYGACTDKMDPITSYVEISNLQKASIHNGQEGSSMGATIAGSINLERKKGDFENNGFSGNVFTGLETNNLHRIGGFSLDYSGKNVFADVDVTYRKANNYKAGGNDEVLYSQFGKLNLSTTLGYKIDPKRDVETSIIYDRATNVGYPALPMDVSLAEAFIASVAYAHHQLSKKIQHWQTKFYYNHVTHVMDDSKRPLVPIRMDMPGWTRTAGMLSDLHISSGIHNIDANINAHYNYSLAEMTMFSNNPNENDMYMLTWPGVSTFYAAFNLKDEIKIAEKWKAVIALGISTNSNFIQNEMGLASLRIFYPEIKNTRSRLLKNISARLNQKSKNWSHHLGIGYGDRAPSVSEGYGFYLFNSYDRFDYVGNPNLKNESSVDLGASSSFRNSMWHIKFQANYFYISNYIIGVLTPSFLPMTIGANGIKVYQQLPHAQILNLSMISGFTPHESLPITAEVSYRYGIGSDGNYLPMIQPLSYSLKTQYKHRYLNAEVAVKGALQQKQFGRAYGETETRSFYIVNIGLSKELELRKSKIQIAVGIENLLDRHYTTFADWNKIPRMGRNFFVNVNYHF